MKHLRRYAASAIALAAIASLWMVAALSRPEALPAVPSPPTPAVLLPAPPPPDPPPARPGTTADEAIVFAYGAATYETLDAQPLPRKLIDVRPVYPPIAVSAGLAGRVVIDGTLDDSGRVADAHVRQSVPLLDQAALDAVRRWVFERTESTARRRQIRITVTYTL